MDCRRLDNGDRLGSGSYRAPHVNHSGSRRCACSNQRIESLSACCDNSPVWQPIVTNILFDLDGTLTDSRPGILNTIQHALRALDIEPPPQPDLLWCVGPPLHEIFSRLLSPADTSAVQRAVNLYRERYHREGHLENSLYAGVPEMLSALKSAGRLFVVTSKHQDSAERILDHFELRSHFDSVFGSEASGRLADKRELVRHVLDTLHLDAANAVMVGDRIHDIVGGRHNGIGTIGAAWGYGTSAELADADHVCATPMDVAALFS